MKLNFSDSRILGLCVILACALVTTWVLMDPNRIPPSPAAGRHKHHEHDEPAHNTPEAQRRMAIFHYNEGNRHLTLKEWDKAIHQYEMALGHGDPLPQVYVNLSTVLLRTGRYAEAGSILTQLEKLAPDLPELHYNLACYFSLTGKTREGLRALETALQTGYKNRKDIESDPDLAALRASPGFEKLMQVH